MISESKRRIELYLVVDGGGEVRVDLEVVCHVIGNADGERRGSVDEKTRNPWRVISNGVIRSSKLLNKKAPNNDIYNEQVEEDDALAHLLIFHFHLFSFLHQFATLSSLKFKKKVKSHKITKGIVMRGSSVAPSSISGEGFDSKPRA